MTRVLGMFVLALLLAPWPARGEDLTLRDVIELHRSGLGEDLLLAVIEADGGPFTLSFADIHDLKADGLSERVIAALVRTGTRRRGAAEAPIVTVEQHQTTVVPGVVVLGGAVAAYGRDHHSGTDSQWPRIDNRRRGDRRHSSDGKAEAPAATWITRREDGRNVSPRTFNRRDDKPAATWVTPNPIRSEPRRTEGGSAPRGDEDRRSPGPPR